MKKLTITVTDEVYEGLHRHIGARRISAFMDRIARPYVDQESAASLYRAAEADPDRRATLEDWDSLPIDDL